jgi:hypothetical protein
MGITLDQIIICLILDQSALLLLRCVDSELLLVPIISERMKNLKTQMPSKSSFSQLYQLKPKKDNWVM